MQGNISELRLYSSAFEPLGQWYVTVFSCEFGSGLGRAGTHPWPAAEARVPESNNRHLDVSVITSLSILESRG